VGATNTGVVLVRNCNWTISFFTDILRMQADNICKTNEQACFRSLIVKDEAPMHAQRHVHVASGLVWNRHPHDRRLDPAHPIVDWATNPATEIVHMMGGAKVNNLRSSIALPHVQILHRILVVSINNMPTHPVRLIRERVHTHTPPHPTLPTSLPSLHCLVSKFTPTL
jgi:hypothetical protein